MGSDTRAHQHLKKLGIFFFSIKVTEVGANFSHHLDQWSILTATLRWLRGTALKGGRRVMTAQRYQQHHYYTPSAEPPGVGWQS